jgi:hypothetical protein
MKTRLEAICGAKSYVSSSMLPLGRYSFAYAPHAADGLGYCMGESVYTEQANVSLK